MSKFSHLPKEVQALIFSFLPPPMVLRVRQLNKTARAAVDDNLNLVGKLFIEQYGIVLPQDISIRNKYLQCLAELHYAMAYSRIALLRYDVKELLRDDRRSQQAKDMMTRMRADGFTLDQCLQTANVTQNSKTMIALSTDYEADYKLISNLAVQRSILSQLLSDDDQGDLIKEIFCQNYGINWHANESLMIAKIIIQSLVRCGSLLGVQLLLRKIAKFSPSFSCADHEFFLDLMRDAIKYGHVDLVRLLLEYGMTGNGLITTSDVNPGSGVAPLTVVATSVKLYVKSAYPTLQSANMQDQDKLMVDFENRMQAYHAMIQLLVDAKGVVDETIPSFHLSSRLRDDSIGMSEQLHNYDSTCPRDLAEIFLHELTGYINENKEQELNPALIIKVTHLIENVLRLLIDAPTARQQESAEIETKRLKY